MKLHPFAAAAAVALMAACASTSGGEARPAEREAPSSHDDGHDEVAPTPVRLEEPPIPELSAEDTATVERIFALQKQIVEILHTHMRDTEKAVAEVEACVAAHGDDIAAYHAMQRREDFDRLSLTKWIQDNWSQFAEIVTKLEEVTHENPALLRDERVVAAMARVGGER